MGGSIIPHEGANGRPAGVLKSKVIIQSQNMTKSPKHLKCFCGEKVYSNQSRSILSDRYVHQLNVRWDCGGNEWGGGRLIKESSWKTRNEIQDCRNDMPKRRRLATPPRGPALLKRILRLREIERE